MLSVQLSNKFDYVITNLFFRNTELGSQIINNLIQRLALLEHFPYSGAHRVNAEADALLDIKENSAVLGSSLSY